MVYSKSMNIKEIDIADLAPGMWLANCSYPVRYIVRHPECVGIAFEGTIKEPMFWYENKIAVQDR